MRLLYKIEARECIERKMKQSLSTVCPMAPVLLQGNHSLPTFLAFLDNSDFLSLQHNNKNIVCSIV